MRSFHYFIAAALILILLNVPLFYDGFRSSPLASSDSLWTGYKSHVGGLFNGYQSNDRNQSIHSNPSISSSNSRYAYATFLSSRKAEGEDDPYFTAARVLTYQILHHPTTKTQKDIPLLILTPPHVSQYKKDTLTREGATVIPIELLKPKHDWTKPANEGWIDQFSKLRLFNMTQYERILFIDGDMLLTRSLDQIFEEQDVQTLQHTGNNTSEIRFDEASLPETYVFVGVSDTGGARHDVPPEAGNDINGGFWLIRPDMKLFEYYESVLNIKDRFDSWAMEQSLLNYAHRKDGNMPFKHFQPGKWNANWPNAKDVEYGTATLHDKFWDPSNAGWIDRRCVEMWWRMQGMMEGYWQPPPS